MIVRLNLKNQYSSLIFPDATLWAIFVNFWNLIYGKCCLKGSPDSSGQHLFPILVPSETTKTERSLDHKLLWRYFIDSEAKIRMTWVVYHIMKAPLWLASKPLFNYHIFREVCEKDTKTRTSVLPRETDISWLSGWRGDKKRHSLQKDLWRCSMFYTGWTGFH